MESVDFALIQDILIELRHIYPQKVRNFARDIRFDPAHYYDVLHYLKEHGCIDLETTHTLGEPKQQIVSIGITAKGIDFLEPNGGLSALNAPMIRITPDSFISIIDAILKDKNAPTKERGLIRKALESASTETMREILHLLINEGAKHVPDIWKIIKRHLET